MVQGTCHCGAVKWEYEPVPDGITACNCTVCRRFGALWAYDYQDHGIRTSGPTHSYARGSAIDFHFCPTCACVTWWLAKKLDGDGRRRMAVNVRLAEPEAVAHLPIDHFDGLDSFDDMPRDGKCVRDYWF